MSRASIQTAASPSAGTQRGLDWLNFFLADVQTGVGPFLAIYLAGYRWNEQSVGIALTVGGIVGILAQTAAGDLVDHLRSKRALIAAGVAGLAVGALLIALAPTFWAILSAQVLIGGTSSIFGPAVCAVSLGVVGHVAFDTRQGRNQTFNSAGNVTGWTFHNFLALPEDASIEVRYTPARSLDEEEAQGFLFSRPLPAAEAQSLLRRAADSPSGSRTQRLRSIIG